MENVLNNLISADEMDLKNNENTLFLKNEKGIKSTKNKELIPTAGRVILLPYDENPYRKETSVTNSGLIVGDFGANERYKSQETGEMEESKKGVWCCKVIAIGKECKSVEVNDDVYINFTLALPLPYGGLGYYSISENNIICSVRGE